MQVIKTKIMKTNLLQQSILSSKVLISTTKSLPTLLAIELEVTPFKKTVESFFSDSIHAISVTRGKVPSTVLTQLSSKDDARLIKRMALNTLSDINNWLSNLKLEEPLVSLQSSDVWMSNVKWQSTRTFLASQLENDLKYRLGIQEFYMDRINLCLKFYFNSDSASYVRAREALLRFNYLPIRLVKRLIKQNVT